jgi:sec-independent protein translocase protein TatC
MKWLSKIFGNFLKFRSDRGDKEAVKPFLDHMEDLRWTLIKVIGTVVAGMVLSFFFADRLTEVMQWPLEQIDPEASKHLIVTKPIEPFMVSLTLAFFAGLVLTFPFLLYFVAEFVFPALTRREKRVIMPAIFGAFALFVAGVVACYYWVLPETLLFFRNWALRMHVAPTWKLGEYFSFVTHLCIACGLLAEIPVVMIVLSVLGLVTYELLNRSRMYAYVIIMVLVAFVSPTPDPFTFLALCFPVILLYEGCIWIVWLIDRSRRKKEAAEREREDREAAEWRQKKWEEQQRAEKEGHESPHTED